MKKTILAIAAIVILIVASAAFKGKEHTGEPIKIGSISALTGVGVAIGEEERNGALLAVEEINHAGGVDGRMLELVTEDVSIDKIKNGPGAVRKLIDVNGVVAIVGAQWDEPTEPILPIIESEKVPMIGADNSDQLEKDRNFEYFFSTWYDNRVGIRELLRFAHESGYKNIAVIRPTDAGFWKFTADTFVDEAPGYGVNIVIDDDLGNALTTDFRTTISRLKQTEPDATFIVTSDYNQCAFLKQAAELGLNTPSLGTESSGEAVSLANCAEELENRYYSTPKVRDEQKEFSETYLKRFGHAPNYPSSVTAYDAVRVIAKALDKTDLEGGEKLRDAIAEIKMEGVSQQTIIFNEKGFVATPEDAFEMMTVRDGKRVSVDNI